MLRNFLVSVMKCALRERESSKEKEHFGESSFTAGGFAYFV